MDIGNDTGIKTEDDDFSDTSLLMSSEVDIWDNIDVETDVNVVDDLDPEIQRPTHIFDTLNSQMEQENAEDLGKEPEEDSEFAARNPDRVKNQESASVEPFKYKRIQIPNDNELRIQTRRLVPEQRQIIYKLGSPLCS